MVWGLYWKGKSFLSQKGMFPKVHSLPILLTLPLRERSSEWDY
jgi:hypothetical protein